MSDHYIHIIPEEAGLVPEEAGRQTAVSYFREIAPDADEVGAVVSKDLEFIHCGENFGNISCPACQAKIEPDLWQQWMEEDYRQKVFVLNRHTLHELVYDWPMGFARCDVVAMNPNIGELSEKQRMRFQEILGCPVRVTYHHI